MARITLQGKYLLHCLNFKSKEVCIGLQHAPRFSYLPTALSAVSKLFPCPIFTCPKCLGQFKTIWTSSQDFGVVKTFLDLKRDKAFVCPDIKPDSFNLD